MGQVIELDFTSEKFVDITEQVAACVAQSALQEALCQVYVPDASAGILLTAKDDPENIQEDIMTDLNRLVPPRTNYRGTGAPEETAGHIMSTLIGCAKDIPVQNGRLALGAFQAVYAVSFGANACWCEISLLGS